jgi:DNA (cytosine-5)-methyltransferase 1
MSLRVLDLFCGAGGCSVGYHRAGFEPEGVDNEPHPDYPFPFHQADALEILADRAFLDRFDLIHASPPCKAFTDLAVLSDTEHPDLLTPTRELLRQWGGPYVIENVEGAPLPGALRLCGSEFELWAVCRDGTRRQLRRHRLFESNVFLMGAGGCHHKGQPIGVYGTGGGGRMTRGYKAHPEEARQAMGIDWMKVEDICQAIPPVYTEFIGEQLAISLAGG